MITRNTVLILGAGASCDYGFPTGRELIMDVADIDPATTEAERLLQGMFDLEFTSRRIKELREPLLGSNAASIDSFLMDRQDFAPLGKALMATWLLHKEAESQLQRSADNEWWYETLIQEMYNGAGSFQEFCRNKLSVVTFNYDRSFEEYFARACRHKYGILDGDLEALFTAIPVIHVYGSLGHYEHAPQTDPELVVEYGATPGRPYSADVTKPCISFTNLRPKKFSIMSATGLLQPSASHSWGSAFIQRTCRCSCRHSSLPMCRRYEHPAAG